MNDERESQLLLASIPAHPTHSPFLPARAGDGSSRGRRALGPCLSDSSPGIQSPEWTGDRQGQAFRRAAVICITNCGCGTFGETVRGSRPAIEVESELQSQAKPSQPRARPILCMRERSGRGPQLRGRQLQLFHACCSSCRLVQIRSRYPDQTSHAGANNSQATRGGRMSAEEALASPPALIVEPLNSWQLA
ncbi:hypothetical protein LX32DRAFT_81221 [Colletotrichum zoysiae]|uniref:Uncharacterized protein n=1 Tax=Colletotrichum zoysiae TaxID=1216348 RepID=A0AAD9LXV4_9PEZI|nr:hypothetical protein LX32DRAFT_81221 [Colletotrichum zoysiae]